MCDYDSYTYLLPIPTILHFLIPKLKINVLSVWGFHTALAQSKTSRASALKGFLGWSITKVHAAI